MDQERWTAVDGYITGLLVPADPALDAALADSAAAGLPAINVSPNQGKMLGMLAALISARGILEIGTLGGYSTIWLGRALPSPPAPAPGGLLITLEADAGHAAVARANLARAGMADVVDVRIGLALETLPQLAAENHRPFDLTFIDADKVNTPAYFEWAVKLSRPGSLIIVDNVIRKGELINSDSEDESVQGMRRFMQMLATDQRVTATAIQTVGTKGYDGFAIVVVR